MFVEVNNHLRCVLADISTHYLTVCETEWGLFSMNKEWTNMLFMLLLWIEPLNCEPMHAVFICQLKLVRPFASPAAACRCFAVVPFFFYLVGSRSGTFFWYWLPAFFPGLLLSLLPRADVAIFFFWPSDWEDLSRAPARESLDFDHGSFYSSPCLRSHLKFELNKCSLKCRLSSRLSSSG